jgi:hypothetical protein
VLRANAGGSATAKAFIASGEMGAATVAFLGAANVDNALDALSPEPYGTSLAMASRGSMTLARALTGAQALGDTWNAQLGYDQQQSTSKASATTLNGTFDLSSTYALLSHKVGTASVFSVLIAENNGKSSASGFASEASGQSYGLGFGTETALGRLDFGVVNGELQASGSSSGQTFGNQNISATTLSARIGLHQARRLRPRTSDSAATSPRATPSSSPAPAPTSTWARRSSPTSRRRSAWATASRSAKASRSP